MNPTSAGILAFRHTGTSLEVLIAHPGGPFYAKKDGGAWSIPKGEPAPDEDLMETARREFQEELGFELHGEMISLGSVRQKGGKVVHAWAVDVSSTPFDPAQCKSNTFQLEWPPLSGQLREFPEIDRAEFVTLDTAREKLNPAQAPLLDRLEEIVGIPKRIIQ